MLGYERAYALSYPNMRLSLKANISEPQKINAIPTKNDYHCAITEEEP
jgi:hypothetical protein